MYGLGLVWHQRTRRVTIRAAVRVLSVLQHPDVGWVAYWCTRPIPRPGDRFFWLFLDEPANRACAVRG